MKITKPEQKDKKNSQEIIIIEKKRKLGKYKYLTYLNNNLLNIWLIIIACHQ
jgi:hypothetical protein